MILQEKNLLKKFKNIGIIKLKNLHQKILVSKIYKNIFVIIIVLGLAANKSDLFDKEQVPEAEARNYSKEIGAIFKLTSACSGTGIEELFKAIGCKFLNPNYKEDEEGSGSGTGEQSSNDEGKVKLDANKAKETTKKKGCC